MNFKFVGMDYKNMCSDYPKEFRVPFGLVTFDKTYWGGSKHEYDLSVKYTNRLLKNVDEEYKKPLRNLLREAFATIRNENKLNLYSLESGIYPKYILKDIYMFLILYAYKKNVDLNIYSKYDLALICLRYLKFKKKIDVNVDVCIYGETFKVNDYGLYIDEKGNLTDIPKRFVAPELDMLLEMA